jgi:hypothetical protein
VITLIVNPRAVDCREGAGNLWPFAKNRWGINTHAVSCPHRYAISLYATAATIRHALWGGWTCSKCCAEVDNWGREVTAQRPAYPYVIVKPEDQTRGLPERRLIVSSSGIFFCLTLLHAWLGIRPSVKQMMWKAWPLWVSVIGSAIMETVIFTALFYPASLYVLSKFVLKKRGQISS